MNNLVWFDAMGWIGAAVLLLGYGMVSFRKLEGDSGFYQLLNIVGSILLAANAIAYGAYPSTFVNMVWIAIAIFAVAAKRRAQSV
jgi:large-conductance mechanosensitive channel